ncbi:MAG: PIN domain-containing protein [Deltaproteobacteria bacterium]|nr:PIN domain-containing protein [Deltaproteobacteria bacterium]
MAQTLILDAEALSALAHATSRAVSAQRARAILSVAHELGALVRVPAPVLAEVFRGGSRDAAVERVLGGKGIRVVDLTARMARHAGALLGAAKLDSVHAIDAFVVATAAALGGGIIAAHDPDDLAQLADREPGVRVWAI